MIALVCRDKAPGTLPLLSLNSDAVFARGEPDKHVQNHREERSGANFEEHLIYISCTYLSYSWHSDRVTSVEWADKNEVSYSRTIWQDMLLLMDSSYCRGRTGDRIVFLTTRPKVGLIDMLCPGDKRSVAINTAHFLSALQGCSHPTDAKWEAISLFTLVKMTDASMLSQIVSFTLSLYEIWLVIVCRSIQNWILYIILFGSSHNFYFVNV